ncbi:unnamed protein product [Callosobruchus maculatus]|uniref:Uncharacterized protein n=1 Tax=Callosobruchus maculatus TaxID=64391 RepID=A0A653BJZ9_CALMS|nr:unnamed protein product [Callosobruchus maculatus]
MSYHSRCIYYLYDSYRLYQNVLPYVASNHWCKQFYKCTSYTRGLCCYPML